ncbi:hypothetical protein LguiB_002733 [Lonicera macranthoides]
MAEEVILLDFWASPFGIRVRIALAEKGIKYEYKEEDLSNKSELLLKANPVNKKIPVLIHNGKAVCESTIILEYIDEVWKDKSPLLPCDPYERAHARFWANYVDQKIYSSGRKLFMTNKGEEQETAKKDWLECFKVLEGELGDKPYFGGQSLGLVDVGLIPFYIWFYTLETVANFSMEAECPKIVGWAKRCMDNDSVSKTLPDHYKVHEILMGLKK